MQIQNNKFVLEFLKQNNIANHKRWQDYKTLTLPNFEGFMEEYSYLYADTLCEIGSLSSMNTYIPRADIKVARYCSVGPNLQFIAPKHPLGQITSSTCYYNDWTEIFMKSNQNYSGGAFKTYKSSDFESPAGPTILENDVYVCTEALLKPGITLHTGCVVAQRAIVTKDVPPYAIVGGAPARVLKYRFDERTRERLLGLEWWKYHFSSFATLDFKKDINFFLDDLEKLIEDKKISPFEPRKVYFSELIERSKMKENVAVSVDLSSNSTNLAPKVAALRVKEHLAYRLGSAIIMGNKNFLGLLTLPFKLYKIKKEFKFEKKIYALNIKQNPNLKLPPLETYADFDKALKEKECFTYKLGLALIRADKAWYKFGYVKFYFEAKRLEREFKENKKKSNQF